MGTEDWVCFQGLFGFLAFLVYFVVFAGQTNRMVALCCRWKRSRAPQFFPASLFSRLLFWKSSGWRVSEQKAGMMCNNCTKKGTCWWAAQARNAAVKMGKQFRYGGIPDSGQFKSWVVVVLQIIPILMVALQALLGIIVSGLWCIIFQQILSRCNNRYGQVILRRT